MDCRLPVVRHLLRHRPALVDLATCRPNSPNQHPLPVCFFHSRFLSFSSLQIFWFPFCACRRPHILLAQPSKALALHLVQCNTKPRWSLAHHVIHVCSRLLIAVAIAAHGISFGLRFGL